MVYFIQGAVTKLVKIGRTDSHIQTRLDALASPDLLVCLKVANVLSERWLHNRFRASWSHGEWFKPERELMEFIEALPSSEYDGLKQRPRSPWGVRKRRREPSELPLTENLAYFNGNRLRLLREGKLWSRVALAKRLKVGGPQIGRWEAANARPRLAIVKKIAKCLHVPVAYFLERSTDEPVIMPQT
jgi:DNA-binding XRE family transcriptional regulator